MGKLILIGGFITAGMIALALILFFKRRRVAAPVAEREVTLTPPVIPRGVIAGEVSLMEREPVSISPITEQPVIVTEPVISEPVIQPIVSVPVTDEPVEQVVEPLPVVSEPVVSERTIQKIIAENEFLM